MSNEPRPMPSGSRTGKRRGILFVISAPSGAGKTTLCRAIIDFFPDLRHSVSFTTRPRRMDEEEGIDYHFVSRETFRGMAAEGRFVEWAEVHGNFYGTAASTLEQALEAGSDILLDIDYQGAAQLKRHFGTEGAFIFILPPGYPELRRRLEKRNTDAVEVIERRIVNARMEIREADWYDYLVVNEHFERALDQLKAIVTAERSRAPRMLPVLESLGLR